MKLPTKRALKEALRELGNTPDLIAGNLIGNACRGVPRDRRH